MREDRRGRGRAEAAGGKLHRRASMRKVWGEGRKGNGCLGLHEGLPARGAADLQAACARRSWGGDGELGGNRAGHEKPKPWETRKTARRG